jgi:hypothetical protein
MKLRDQAYVKPDGSQFGFRGPLAMLLGLVQNDALFDFFSNYQDDDELWTHVEAGTSCARAVVYDKTNRVVFTTIELDDPQNAKAILEPRR